VCGESVPGLVPTAGKKKATCSERKHSTLRNWASDTFPTKLRISVSEPRLDKAFRLVSGVEDLDMPGSPLRECEFRHNTTEDVF
jgi:hypothetical protein